MHRRRPALFALPVLAAALVGLPASAQDPAPGEVFEVEVRFRDLSTMRFVETVDSEVVDEATSDGWDVRLVWLERIDRLDPAGRPDRRTRHVLEGVATRLERPLGEASIAAVETVRPLVVGRSLRWARAGEDVDVQPVSGDPLPSSWNFAPGALLDEPERWVCGAVEAPEVLVAPDALRRAKGSERLPGWPSQARLELSIHMLAMRLAGPSDGPTGLRRSVTLGPPGSREATWSLSLLDRNRAGAVLEENEWTLRVQVTLRAASRPMPE